MLLLLLAFGIVNVLQVGVSEAQSLSSLLTSLEGRGLCRAVAEGRWRTERAQNLLGGPIIDGLRQAAASHTEPFGFPARKQLPKRTHEGEQSEDKDREAKRTKEEGETPGEEACVCLSSACVCVSFVCLLRVHMCVLCVHTCVYVV